MVPRQGRQFSGPPTGRQYASVTRVVPVVSRIQLSSSEESHAPSVPAGLCEAALPPSCPVAWQAAAGDVVVACRWSAAATPNRRSRPRGRTGPHRPFIVERRPEWGPVRATPERATALTAGHRPGLELRRSRALVENPAARLAGLPASPRGQATAPPRERQRPGWPSHIGANRVSWPTSWPAGQAGPAARRGRSTRWKRWDLAKSAVLAVDFGIPKHRGSERQAQPLTRT